MARKKTWALSYEIHTLDAAVEAARILTDMVTEERAANEHDHVAATSAASAVLTLVNLRMKDIGRVLRGELAPETLHGVHNESPEDAEGRDVVFGARRRR